MMKIKIITGLIIVVLIWMLLLDLCLTRRFSAPFHWLTCVGLSIQAVVSLGFIAALNARPGWGDYVIKIPSTRIEVIAIAFPFFLLLLSPAMVAHGVNFALYGEDKLIVGEHMRMDLSICCANPFAKRRVNPHNN